MFEEVENDNINVYGNTFECIRTTGLCAFTDVGHSNINIFVNTSNDIHNRTVRVCVSGRGGGLGSSTIFKKFNEPYAPS